MLDEYMTIPKNQFLDMVEKIRDLETEVERLKAELHKPRGIALLTPFNNVNACAAVGATQFMNNQVTEHIICSCGDIYPKGTEHKHT